MIELSDRLVVPVAPRLSAVERHARALIGAEQHALAVRRIDPHAVIVFAARGALEHGERVAAVGRAIERHADDVHDVGILGIDPHTRTVVPLSVADARFTVSHVLPRRAAVVGSMDAGPVVDGATDDVDALAVRVHCDGHADAAGIRRQRLDLRPGLALVDRLEEPGCARRGRGAASTSDSAARCAGSATSAAALRRGKDDGRHVERIFQISRPAPAFGVEDVLPRLSAVGRAKHAASPSRGVAGRGREDKIGILGIDDELVDLQRLVEADVRPGLAGVGRLVHPSAGGTADRIARADVDDVRVRRRYLNGADAVSFLYVIEDRIPGHAGAGCLPDAALGCAHVEGASLVLADHARDSGNPAAVEGADVAPLESCVKVGADLLALGLRDSVQAGGDGDRQQQAGGLDERR